MWQIFLVFHSTYWQIRYKTLSVFDTANTDIRCPIMGYKTAFGNTELGVCSSHNHPIKTFVWRWSVRGSKSKKDDVKVISAGRGGGRTSKKNWVGVCGPFLGPSHHWRTKSAIYPTLFMTSWPKLRYSPFKSSSLNQRSVSKLSYN